MAESCEDFQTYCMGDGFDDEYADELEVLRELEYSDIPPRSRKRLQYSPPPAPNCDGKIVGEPELNETPLPAKRTHHSDVLSEGEPVARVHSDKFALGGKLEPHRMCRGRVCSESCC